MLRIFSDRRYKFPCRPHSVISAIRDGDLAKVEYHIDTYGIDKHYSSYVLLCGALKFRHKEMALFLLMKGAQVNSRENREIGNTDPTPLHLAVHLCDEEIMDWLLQKGALTDVVAGCGLGTPLCDAVRYNKVKMIAMLLRYGASVNTPGFEGETPLQIAIGKRSFRVTKMLLEYGADPTSALQIAAGGGNLEAVKLLLSKGANINAEFEINTTPLHIAAENRHGQLVDFLLKQGADVNAVDFLKTSVLCTAVETGCPVIVSIILSHCPDLKKKTNQNAVQTALRLQNKTDVPHERHVYGEIIQNLLSYGFTIADRDAHDPKPLYVAIRNGHIKTVAELIKRGSNIQKLRNSILSKLLPLYPSTLSDNLKLANILVKYGADDNTRCTMGLRPAKTSLFFRNMDLDMFKVLLTDRANVKHDPDVLKFAVWHGYFEIAKCLLRYGADANAKDSSGRAPLHFCVLRPKNALCPILQRTRSCVKIDTDIVKELVSSGADVDVSTKMGETSLHIAAQNNLIEIVEVLVELKANVNAVDDQGKTALHHVARNGNLGMSEYLLSKGAEVNAKDKVGMTPIHVASEFGRLDIVKSLLENGADVDVNGKEGTALHIACREGRSDVVKLLVEYGADVNVTTGDLVTPPIAIAIRRFYMGDPRGPWGHLGSLFLRHLFKMKAANLFLNEKNLNYTEPGSPRRNGSLETAPFFVPDNYYEKCEEEVAIMKHENFEGSNFSCYDILVENDVRLAKLSANESLKKVVNSDDFEQTFPIYGALIKKRYQKGKWMRELRENCGEIFLSIAPHLPYLCIERILAHLSVSDMRMLTHAMSNLFS